MNGAATSAFPLRYQKATALQTSLIVMIDRISARPATAGAFGARPRCDDDLPTGLALEFLPPMIDLLRR
jgi:hypothetical protein